MSKFNLSKKLTRGYTIERTAATPGHSDFNLINKKTGHNTVVPQTSFHRYIKDYGWNVAKIVNYRNGAGQSRCRVY